MAQSDKVWDTLLDECAINGLTLPCSGRTATCQRRFGKHVFPGRDGQQTEDIGRDSYTFALNIPLFADMFGNGREDFYPGKYSELLSILQDPDVAGAVTYTDPVLGDYECQIVDWSIEEIAENRDGATVALTLVERTTDIVNIFFPLTSPSGGTVQTALAVAGEADDAVGNTDEFDPIAAINDASGYPLAGVELLYEPFEIFYRQTKPMMDLIALPTTTSDQLVAGFAKFKKRVLAVRDSVSHEKVGTAVFDAKQAMSRLVYTMDMEIQRSLSRTTTIGEFVCPMDMTSYAVAFAVYEDASRHGEIERLNQHLSPTFYPQGAKVKVAYAPVMRQGS